MSRIDHSFDWKGCAFFLKTLAVCAVVGTAGWYGVAYSLSYTGPSNPPALVAVQTASPEPASSAALSTSTPQRVINSLTIADAVPATGKFIAADLVNMKLYLYQDGTTTAEYPILTKGKPGTPWDTPSGFYNIDTKEENHFSSTGKVYMPYSMQFFGNYFIHGWPYYPDGTPVASTYSGGCIRLSTDDASRVFAFADRGTGLFVYDAKTPTALPSLSLGPLAPPDVSAAAYVVADIDTGDVFVEKNAQTQMPIASVTELMTGLVANETINFEQHVPVMRGSLEHPADPNDTTRDTFLVGDLLYPLLMESNGAIADALASYYGTPHFVQWMNTTAKALDMTSTHFVDATGTSSDNVSTPDDLYRLAVYLANKKSFVWNITRTPHKTISATDGTSYTFGNYNLLDAASGVLGSKVGTTTPAQDTMVSVFSLPVGGEQRRVAVIVLNSSEYAADTQKLADWFDKSASATSNAACVACTTQPQYRQIQL